MRKRTVEGEIWGHLVGLGYSTPEIAKFYSAVNKSWSAHTLGALLHVGPNPAKTTLAIHVARSGSPPDCTIEKAALIIHRAETKCLEHPLIYPSTTQSSKAQSSAVASSAERPAK